MITFSLCMIVKNEEAVLCRLLEQMKDIADEIIIVDTGSTDRTKEIAFQYTENVFDYPWKQDFAAARNYACSKAVMDYWMWLDADDVVSEPEQKKLLELKKELNSDTDVVMMKYLTGFDENGAVTFSYYRERLLKNRAGFCWTGRVHEAVTPRGKILYAPIAIEHRKIGGGDPHRNLRIYEKMIAEGEGLEPRHQFYYGRELYYHSRYQEAIQIFERFLEEPGGWIENRIDACVQIAVCYEHLGKRRERLMALLRSFLFDTPRAEVCCELGRAMMEENKYYQAAYWYHQALDMEMKEDTGAFIRQDCYGFLPAIQLCVCYDRLGDEERALEYHRKSMKYKPDSQAVKYNEEYFLQKAGVRGEPVQ